MKNIKYIVLSLSLLIMTACADDDFSRAYVDTEAKVQITGSIQLDRAYSSPGFPVGFSFTLGQSVGTESTVEVTATLYDLTTVRAYVRIPSGATSGSGTFDLPHTGNDTNGFDGISDYASVSLTGIALTQPEDGSVADPYVLSSEPAHVLLYDRVQWPYGSSVIAGRMTALFDWADSGNNDLDMYMYNADTFALVEAAGTGSRWETDIFNDTHPDGNYFIAIDFWQATGDDIPYKFFFVHPNQLDITLMEGVFTNVTPGGGDFVYPVINFTKTTDGNGVVSYTFSQP